MGVCCSCLRLLLNESDVKIHVIEPTSIANEHSDATPPSPSPLNNGPTLQVPPLMRPRSPDNQDKKEKDGVDAPKKSGNTLTV